MIEDMDRELEIVNEKATELEARYRKIAEDYTPEASDRFATMARADMVKEFLLLEEGFKLATRGEVVVRRKLGRLMAEAL